MRNAKPLGALFVLVLAVFAMPAVSALPATAAKAPTITQPAAPVSAWPASTPVPIFMAQYVCTCEVLDPCTVPFGFVLLGGLCDEGQGCTCSGRYDSHGCLTGSDFQCTGNSES